MQTDIIKYPRTHHIEGSRFQPGDEELDCIPFSEIEGRYVVIEEKLDGANSGVSVSEDRLLKLQSRGHTLTGGFRERHFDLFKQWATTHSFTFQQVLGDRYIAYGEWLYAKHTIFYDRLPHFWLEFDVYDKTTQRFLDTESRHKLFTQTPVQSVPVLFRGQLKNLSMLNELIGKSLYISEGTQRWEHLESYCDDRSLSFELVRKETDPSELMEGLYIKVEEDGQVLARYKFIRASFLQTVLQSESHWLSRPIVPNLLADDLALFGL